LKLNHAFAQECYRLEVDKKGVVIEGSETGVFYGIQTLIQLLPTEQTGKLTLPYVSIKDKPRFAYRGLLLDVSRHFFPVSFIKKYIDYMAYHKLNHFHWHLCDDQGWRLEIKALPRLTEVGAWRDGTIIGLYPGKGNDNKRYGGFYTQDEVREVVQYAAKRYITVIPEIEMPGHCLAALSAYPYLGCTGKNYQVAQTWGISKDVLCIGNDSVFTFLQKVIDEVIDLFPSHYIHIGGDECPRDSWKTCPKCQARIKSEGLSNEGALQSYLVSRMGKYIQAKGRQIVAWDETLDEDTTTSAYIMSWHGDGTGGCLKATSTNHYVIMTPSYGFYFDYPQQAAEDSLVANWGGTTPVSKVYAFEPVLPQVAPEKRKYIIGAQAHVWTEYMSNPQKVEYMLFPRLSAMSEVVWSPQEKREWKDFKQRMQKQYKRYVLWKTAYNPANIDLK
jgi:hexosaminidase